MRDEGQEVRDEGREMRDERRETWDEFRKTSRPSSFVRLLVILALFCPLSAVPCTLTYAAEQQEPDARDMRAEYDKISAIKMEKYDELTREITETQGRLEGLLAQEQKLSGEKKKAEADFAKRAKAAANAEENVKKALENASAEDEKMKDLAAAVGKERTARQKKIEKLKADLKEVSGKKEQRQSSKKKTEAANAARDTEYKDLSKRLLALKDQSSAGGKPEAGAAEESARLQKLMSELEIKTQEGESLRQRQSGEILSFAEKTRAIEDELSALESEDALQSKELQMKIGNFEKTPNGDSGKGSGDEALRKIAAEAASQSLHAKAALRKIEEDLEKVSGERIQAEKDREEKTDELKVRISALVVQSERDQALFPQDVDPGEKNVKKRLKRAEKDVVALRRKMERDSRVHEKLEAKFNKEILDKHFNLAVIYEMDGLYQDAEREYLQCLKMDPKDADAHYNLAILYDDRLNDNTKAQRHYYEFLAYRPIGESGEIVRDWIMRSELEKRVGSTVR